MTQQQYDRLSDLFADMLDICFNLSKITGPKAVSDLEDKITETQSIVNDLAIDLDMGEED